MKLLTQVQIVKSKLIELGYLVGYIDIDRLTILNYKLPQGWNKEYTDLLLVVPDNDQPFHGINIPVDLHTVDGVVMPKVHPDNYQQGWNLISFRLKPGFNKEKYVKSHMSLVYYKLSVKK